MIAAITSLDKADTTVAQVRQVQIVSDKGAAKVQLSDDEIMAQYPLSSQELVVKCKEAIPGLKLNKRFYKILGDLRQNASFAFGRINNPKSTKKARTYFYREPIIQEIKKRWNMEDKQED